MSTPNPGSRRPLSPFMIGPYYRPQLTSMLSILHRITGLVLCAGALALAWWLAAIAAGPDSHARFAAFATSIPGTILFLAVGFALSYHWFNGLRHLFWDTGTGLDIRHAYASGWAVIALAAVSTAGFAWLLLGSRGGA